MPMWLDNNKWSTYSLKGDAEAKVRIKTDLKVGAGEAGAQEGHHLAHGDGGEVPNVGEETTRK